MSRQWARPRRRAFIDGQRRQTGALSILVEQLQRLLLSIAGIAPRLLDAAHRSSERRRPGHSTTGSSPGPSVALIFAQDFNLVAAAGGAAQRAGKARPAR